jgi:hypothetical protein
MLLQTGNSLSLGLRLATMKLVALHFSLSPLTTISRKLLDQLQPLLPITELSFVPSSSFLLLFKQAELNNVLVEISFSSLMKLHLQRILVIGKILVVRCLLSLTGRYPTRGVLLNLQSRETSHLSKLLVT